MKSAYSVGDAGDVGSVPGSGRFLEEEEENHSSILAWRIPWTEETGGPHSIGSQRVGQTKANEHTDTNTVL